MVWCAMKQTRLRTQSHCARVSVNGSKKRVANVLVTCFLFLSSSQPNVSFQGAALMWRGEKPVDRTDVAVCFAAYVIVRRSIKATATTLICIDTSRKSRIYRTQTPDWVYEHIRVDRSRTLEKNLAQPHKP